MWEQSILTFGSRVLTAHPVICGIQREAGFPHRSGMRELPCSVSGQVEMFPLEFRGQYRFHALVATEKGAPQYCSFVWIICQGSVQVKYIFKRPYHMYRPDLLIRYKLPSGLIVIYYRHRSKLYLTKLNVTRSKCSLITYLNIIHPVITKI